MTPKCFRDLSLPLFHGSLVLLGLITITGAQKLEMYPRPAPGLTHGIALDLVVIKFNHLPQSCF